MKKPFLRDLLDVKFIFILDGKFEPSSLGCINNNLECTAVFVAGCISCFINYLMAAETEEIAGNLF
jgi:hypothetical protein